MPRAMPRSREHQIMFTPRRRSPAFLLSASLLSLLSGCATGPAASPQATVTPTVTSFVGEGLAPSTVPTKWWRLYREPALDALVEEALTNNRDLREAAAHLLEARAILREVRGQRLPQTKTSADAGGGSTLQDQIGAAYDNSDHIRTGSRFGLGADVVWEADLFGRLAASVEASRADTDAARAEEDGVRVLVAAEVTRNWLGACGYSHRIFVARRSLTLLEQGREIAERLRAAGVGLPVDVVRADTLVAEAQAAIPPLEAARAKALAELAVLTGRPPTEVPAAAAACTRLPTIDAPMPIGDGLDLLRRRPDVRAAERRLAGMTAQIGVATADLYPRISLGANIASSSHTPGDLTARNNIIWRIGPLLSWSFPNINAARARIAQARAREIGALARFDATILTALREVNQAGEEYEATLRRREALRIAADRSAEAVRLSRLGRAAGSATALEALDAERADLGAQAALATADSEVATAQVVLFKALGGGWEDAPTIILPKPVRTSSAAATTRPFHE